MFTVTRLGLTGALLRTVASTNPVESVIEIVRDHARNVKRWKDGDIRLRWAAAGMLAAAGQFRRVQGHAQLPQLAGALAQVTASCSQRSPNLSGPDLTMRLEIATNFHDQRVILPRTGGAC